MNIIWFRRDLRVLDNLALTQACATGKPVIAVYFEATEQFRSHHLAPIQADLIYRRLGVLQKMLEALNIPLIVRSLDHFSDITVSLAQLCHQYKIEHVYCNKDYELDEVNRDESVKQTLDQAKIGFHAFDEKCMFAPGSLLSKTGGVYRVFTPFKKAWLARIKQRQILPCNIPNPVTLTPQTQALLNSKSTIIFRYPLMSSVSWVVDDNTILQRLRAFCRHQVQDYNQLRDFPSESATSQLSPYLAIGALSLKQCIARLHAEDNECFELADTGAQVWLSELIWREFYQHITALNPHLSTGKSFQAWTDEINWNNDQVMFDAWKQGKTGFPIVDAAMRQLNETGWMHNRLRMIAASFLVKDLHINWRWGERYFMSRLIDGDFAANNGGWQWAASVGTDAQPYFRVFNPITQSKKFDPEALFLRKWLKEIQTLPDKALYEPHVWAEKQGVFLDYPHPIVDHNMARKTAISLFEQAKFKHTS